MMIYANSAARPQSITSDRRQSAEGIINRHPCRQIASVQLRPLDSETPAIDSISKIMISSTLQYKQLDPDEADRR